MHNALIASISFVLAIAYTVFAITEKALRKYYAVVAASWLVCSLLSIFFLGMQYAARTM